MPHSFFKVVDGKLQEFEWYKQGAIEKALEDHGVDIPVVETQRAAQAIYGEPISYQYVVNVRLAYIKANNIARPAKSRKEAIQEACLKIGFRSSVPDLQEQAEAIYGGPVDCTYCSVVRNQYGKYLAKKDPKKYGDLANLDRRTYEGQFRRNMLNDQRVTATQLARWRHFNSLQRRTAAATRRLIGEGEDKIHSIEHFVTVVCGQAASLKIAA
jgi:hypothetical protein